MGRLGKEGKPVSVCRHAQLPHTVGQEQHKERNMLKVLLYETTTSTKATSGAEQGKQFRSNAMNNKYQSKRLCDMWTFNIRILIQQV